MEFLRGLATQFSEPWTEQTLLDDPTEFIFFYFDMSVPRIQEAGGRKSPSSASCVDSSKGLKAVDTFRIFRKQFSCLFCLSPRMIYQIRGYPSVFFPIINSSLNLKVWKSSVISL
jgi:hypothetical protein